MGKKVSSKVVFTLSDHYIVESTAVILYTLIYSTCSLLHFPLQFLSACARLVSFVEIYSLEEPFQRGSGALFQKLCGVTVSKTTHACSITEIKKIYVRMLQSKFPFTNHNRLTSQSFLYYTLRIKCKWLASLYTETVPSWYLPGIYIDMYIKKKQSTQLINTVFVLLVSNSNIQLGNMSSMSTVKYEGT